MNLNNGSNTAADVYYGEYDKSVRAGFHSSSVAALVGASRKGPVGVPTLATSRQQFRDLFGAPDYALGVAHVHAEQYFSEGNQLYFVRIAEESKYATGRIAYEQGLSVPRPTVRGFEDVQEYVFDSQDVVLFYAADQGKWGDDVEVMLYPDTFDPDEELFIVDVFYQNKNMAAETFRCTLREKQDGYGRQLGIEHVLKASKYVRARVNFDHATLVQQPEYALINSLVRLSLSHGDDGLPVTEDQVIDAWDHFEDPEDLPVTLLLNGGWSTPNVHRKMLQLAEDRGDAFAILDLPADMQTVQKAVEYRRNILNTSSSYGALYGPNVQVRTDDNTLVNVPPSGFVSAVYARTDREAAEWFAPAGITRGKVAAEGVTIKYLQGDRNVLDQNQINFIHVMPGTGLVLWSQETLQAHKSSLSNIHVRRLLNMLRVMIRNVSYISLFEPGDQILWTELHDSAVGVLEPVKRGRGLYGYEVICDESNNPPEIQANGDTVIDIYLDAIMVAKRIHLNANVVRRGQVEYAVNLLDRT